MAGYLTRVYVDKTGSLTNSRMSVVKVIAEEAAVYKSFRDLSEELKDDIIIGAGINNGATISGKREAIESNDIDRALLTYLTLENGVIIDKNIAKKIEPFDSRVKYSTITMPSGVKYFKGAPEIVMQGCNSYLDDDGNIKPISKDIMNKLRIAWNKETSMAMHVIAIVKEYEEIRTFVALISIKDDIRSNIKETVKKMLKAGVNVTMVTGDALATARSIAVDTGLINQITDICITHEDLLKMSDDELISILPKLKVVARVVPSDKERLIRVSHSIGEVVATTGNGINDVTALNEADVGFAMGSGKEIAKEVGDIVILNDSLTSIAKAIMYGRTICKSVKKFITFYLTINISTVFTIILGFIFGCQEVFTIAQIFWIKIIMDTFATVAFGQESAKESYMEEKPCLRTADILNKYSKSSILIGSSFITIVCIGIMQDILGACNLIGSTNIVVVKTFMFNTFIMSIIWNSFNIRTESMNLFKNITKNYIFIFAMLGVWFIQILIIQVLGNLFGAIPLSFESYIKCQIISYIIIPIDCVRKIIFNKTIQKEQ